eukprot:TRINITY_DN10275_c0_g1_i1.p1 TRINITY_DN10275_c0_g1~~TRINITY_DN10275_c0_g1_i1.p1  ORF type:complete len:269 (+),score=64.24 TRINITY_DN10275_c0_g1_i1:117-923(+)
MQNCKNCNVGFPVIKKIDRLICSHLKQDWVPAERAKLQEKRSDCVKRLEALGAPPGDLTVAELATAFEAAMGPKIAPAAIDEMCKCSMQGFPQENLAATASLFESVEAKHKLEMQYREFLKDDCTKLFDQVTSAFTSKIRDAIDHHSTGRIRLVRFRSFRNALSDSAARAMLGGKEDFCLNLNNILEFYFLVACGKKEFDVQTLNAALAECMMIYLIGPAKHSISVSSIQNMLKEIPEESCVEERASINQMLADINRVDSDITSLMDV